MLVSDTERSTLRSREAGIDSSTRSTTLAEPFTTRHTRFSDPHRRLTERQIPRLIHHPPTPPWYVDRTKDSRKHLPSTKTNLAYYPSFISILKMDPDISVVFTLLWMNIVIFAVLDDEHCVTCYLILYLLFSKGLVVFATEICKPNVVT